MANYGQHFSTRKTPQNEQARPDQKQNNAGGYVFTLDVWQRLDRWLILGAEGGTYYASEQKLTRDNAKTILECLRVDGIKTVNRIVEISDSGRAPKNDPAIFALAMAAGDMSENTRKAALEAVPKVCRIGTHLFHFARDVENFRKWGRGLRTAVAKWYLDKPIDKLAYDLVKYQQRDGWSHKDLLRLSHAQPKTNEQNALFRYIVDPDSLESERVVKRRLSNKEERFSTYAALGTTPPRIIEGFEKAKVEKDPKAVARLVTEYGLTREMVPTESLNSVEVWEALLEKMPMTAMIRSLGKMTAIGLVKPMSAASKKVVSALEKDALKKARVHPISILLAQRVYAQGHGEKGKLSWAPVPQVIDALDEAFYLAFDNVVPTGKNIMLAHDISGSMSGGVIAGAPGVTPIIASAAMAMVTARVEKNWHAVGFTCDPGGRLGGMWGPRTASNQRPLKGSGQIYPGLTELSFSSRQRLDDVARYMLSLPMGGTDCALPMVYAKEAKLEVDVFQVYTDSETWAGSIQPFQALQEYRQASGRNAKLVVVGMTATEFTIADPTDAGMLDVVGFDASAPAIMADFARS